ncbi:MAG: hydroxymethylpyrimidine/phosphomethylpyrimidine kinase [Planctomycetota bacterium]
MRRLLLVSGIDPTGGAGLGLDVRVAARRDVRIATVPSCLTEQDRNGFRRADAIDDAWIAAMLRAVVQEGPIDAMKVGLCADPGTVRVIARWLRDHVGPLPAVVVDPVLSATAGGSPRRAVEVAHAIVEELVPLGVLITPNAPELRRLAPGGGVCDLLARGARAVLLKGGHDDGDVVVDRLVRSGEDLRFEHPRIRRGPVHGTGCALATGFAARLAEGIDIEVAAREAIADVARWIAISADRGDGRPDPLELD